LPKRFYHIAFELGVTPRRFIQELAAAGLSVGNQMVVIPERLETRIREVYELTHKARVSPPPEPPPPPPPPPVEEPVVEVEPEPVEPEVAPVVPPDAGPEAPTEVGAPAAEPVAGGVNGDAAAAAKRERAARRRPGEAPKPTDLVPTLDPRAGRLIKEAPRGGLPTARPPARGRPGEAAPPDLNPALPSPPRAPGARRDSRSRGDEPGFRGKQGKETFTLRKRSPVKAKPEPVVERPKSFEVEPPLPVKRFSELTGIKTAEVLKVLFVNHKMIVNTNSMLDEGTLEILALEFDLDLRFVKTATAEDELLTRVKQTDAAEHLVSRPPVVTILGHVDHGKTSLLDKIRTTDIAAREAGGITQHIGASQVKLPDGRRVTFIDTPGHAAFSEMRARGAQVTDVAVLVVAADDGVMPQTVEAVSHAKAAGVTLVVAITKCDKPSADPDRVKKQLTEHGVFVEGWGGDVSCFEVSAVTGQGLPELLEHIALMNEVEAERFRANPARLAEGTVVEAANSPRRGVVATVLVQNGTLHKGDAVLAGESWGTVRALFDGFGRPVTEAGPGDPVEVIGLDLAPEAGVKFYSVEDVAQAREMAEERQVKARERERAREAKPTTVESLLGAIDQGKVQGVNLVLKTDVKGSLAPIRTMLERLGTEEVRVKIVHAAAGAVNESDVILANASGAWIVGFNVTTDEKARAKAKMLGVSIYLFKIVYEIEDAVRAALEGKLAPEIRDTIQGHLEVLKLFASSKLGTIAGCRVKDGLVRRDSWIRVKRGGAVLAEARVASLRREKDEAREVKEGLECGIRIEGWDQYQVGDELEAFSREEIARRLA
jgi:translation initiation factor IF-2